jgi:hypothetical protein
MLIHLQIVEALCFIFLYPYSHAMRWHSRPRSPLSKTIRFNLLEVVSHAGGKKKAFDKF